MNMDVINNYHQGLLNWLLTNGWSGWDPYDIYDSWLGRWATKKENILQRGFNYLLSEGNELSPILLRRMLDIKPSTNPKAMGLFALSFLKLAEFGQPAKKSLYQESANQCLGWLNNNKVTKYGGCGWGYPFNWQSRILIKKHTPTAVNSSIIGNAYWWNYVTHGDEKALNTCKSICEFFLNGLNRSMPDSDGSFCFSYTPVDNFQVHNANLFVSEFLIRIGTETSNYQWVDIGLQALNFSLAEIRDDGTLNYWSNDQASGVQQDTYHSGFEIRALNAISRTLDSNHLTKKTKIYFNAWLEQYLPNDGALKLGGSEEKCVEVHRTAEAVLVLKDMLDSEIIDKEIFVQNITKVLPAITELWVQGETDSGYFTSKACRGYAKFLKSEIPYIRWGQAWMFLALTELKRYDTFPPPQICN